MGVAFSTRLSRGSSWRPPPRRRHELGLRPTRVAPSTDRKAWRGPCGRLIRLNHPANQGRRGDAGQTCQACGRPGAVHSAWTQRTRLWADLEPIVVELTGRWTCFRQWLGQHAPQEALATRCGEIAVPASGCSSITWSLRQGGPHRRLRADGRCIHARRRAALRGHPGRPIRGLGRDRPEVRDDDDRGPLAWLADDSREAGEMLLTPTAGSRSSSSLSTRAERRLVRGRQARR